MRLIPVIAAALVLGAAGATFAPAAEAGHVIVSVGIGVPGFAIAAPAPVFFPPAPYYGPAYAPAFYGVPPVVVYRAPFRGYYGRPYVLRRAWR
jgi:hypothetical protein